MAILQSCCCWRSLRKGSYASAAYTTVYFGVTVCMMANFMHEERLYWSGNATTPQSTSFIEPDTISPITMVFNIVVLVCGSLGIPASLTLVYGLYKDKRAFLIPWIMTVVAAIIIDLAHSLYLFILETMKFNPMTAILFTVDFFLLTLNTYCLLCVVSQYQEYRAGRGTADFDDVYRVPGVRYTPQPTGTSCLSTRRAVTYHETRATPTQSPSHLGPGRRPGGSARGRPRGRQAAAPAAAPEETRTVRRAPLVPDGAPADRIPQRFGIERGDRKRGCSPSEGGSPGDWTPKTPEIVDTEPLIEMIKGPNLDPSKPCC